jgi:hypothetical protein
MMKLSDRTEAWCRARASLIAGELNKYYSVGVFEGRVWFNNWWCYSVVNGNNGSIGVYEDEDKNGNYYYTTSMDDQRFGTPCEAVDAQLKKADDFVEKMSGIISNNKTCLGIDDVVEHQVRIVKERLHYHFKKVDGDWMVPDGMPFMKELLNSVDGLCELVKSK